EDGLCNEAANGAGACGDGVDNDSNNLTDCFDTTCAADTDACPDGLLGGDCDNPIVMATDVVIQTDTCAYSADFVSNSGNSGCAATGSSPNGGAGDFVAEFEAPTAGPYIARLDAGFDSVYNVVAGGGDAGDECPASPLNACIGGLDTPNVGGIVAFTAAQAGDVFYLVVDGYWTRDCGLASFVIEATTPETDDACRDGVDNDYDGDTDCLDDDCEDNALCDEAGYVDGCSDDQDNDGDGDTDCDDSDCEAVNVCNESTYGTDSCSDAQDNDGDGNADCDDWDCKVATPDSCNIRPGDVCGLGSDYAIEITALPFSDDTLDTANFNADHTINETGGCQTHLGSGDVVYELVAPNDGQVEVVLTASHGEDIVLNVSTECAADKVLSTCIASADANTNGNEEVTFDVTKDERYYIYVNAFIGTDTMAFTLDVSEVAP
ncbi:MAG: hypothetical protein CSA66_08160, partial [Proteobacteria bacterium]